mgnify:CR=1 FL=1
MDRLIQMYTTRCRFIVRHAWTVTMCFITWSMFRNMWEANSYLWWPYKHWIQAHPFETVIVLLIIGLGHRSMFGKS